MGYAPSFTPRYVAKYRAGGRQHNIMCRGYIGETSSVTIARGQIVLHDLMANLVGKLPDDFLWVSAKYIPEDTETSVPAAVPASVTGAVALANFSKKDRISAIHFPGHSTNSPAGMFVYSLQFTEDVVPDADESDFLITTVEDTDIANAIATLNTQGVAGIDGTTVTWYNQVTYKANDFYVKKVRRGL